MSPITKIALRRIKLNLHKSIFQMIAIGFSMLIISFFAFFRWQTVSTQNPAYEHLPFDEFMGSVEHCMNLTIAFLLIITFLTVRIYGRLRSEENSTTLAILTSVGATARQKRQLMFVELCLLYLPPILLGVMGGSLPGIIIGRYFQGVSDSPISNLPICLLLAIALIAAGVILVMLSTMLPEISFKPRTVIQSVRKQNLKASEEKHSYRQSKTFRNQSLLKRLAKKSSEFHAKTYNRIALSFSIAALYPILALLLFGHISHSRVVIDANPFDQMDTSAAVIDAVKRLFLFLGGCFSVLTVAGLVQAAIMVRMQMLSRYKTTKVYLAIGMEETDIRKMIGHELKSVCLRAFIYLIFGAYIINACFGI